MKRTLLITAKNIRFNEVVLKVVPKGKGCRKPPFYAAFRDLQFVFESRHSDFRGPHGCAVLFLINLDYRLTPDIVVPLTYILP